MKADEMSRKYLALQADGAVGKMELNQEIAAALERLPEDPSLYFDLGEAHLLIPLEQLVNARMRERGIISANRYMLASARGKQEKRKPLTVHALGNGAVARGGREFNAAQCSSFQLAGCTLHHG